MALLVAKGVFWEGASKRVFTICDTQKLCSAENIILFCFQQQNVEKKRVSCKKQITNNWELFANMQKVFFFGAGGLVDSFLFLLFCSEKPKHVFQPF